MSFTDLYGRVLRLVEHGQAVDEAVDTLDIIEAQATILYVTHASSGVKGFEARYAGWQPLRTVKKDGKPFKKPVIDPIERDRLLTGLWIPIRSELARNWPDRVPTTPTDLIWISKGDGICLDERWRQRAEDDATALKLLAELAHEVEELDAKNSGRKRPIKGQEKWRQAMQKMLSLLVKEKLKGSVRKAAKQINETDSTTLKAANKSIQLRQYFNLESIVNDDIRPELVNELSKTQLQHFKNLPDDQQQAMQEQFKQGDKENVLETLTVLASNPDAGSTGDVSLCDNDQDSTSPDHKSTYHKPRQKSVWDD